jgi:hypothetical protein
MALESLDVIEKMSPKELLKRASQTLDEYRKMRGQDQHTLLIDSEFYLRALRDKQEQRSRRLEVLLELVIIGLIGLELYDGYQQAKTLEAIQQGVISTRNQIMINGR